jgi:predicted HTH domain antitoxin
MSSVLLEYPPEWLPALGTDAGRFAEDVRLASAMKLFEVGRLSSGQAAQIAGLSRVAFLLSCRQWGVASLDLDEAELEGEFTRPLA